MKECPNCKYQNKDNSKFCVNCGIKFEDKKNCCPRCGFELKQKSKFCTACGYKFNSFDAISTMNSSYSDKNIADEIVLSRFRFVNWLDYIQYQKFNNLEAEQAFKILYYYFIYASDLYNNSDDFIKKRFDEEHSQILDQIPRSFWENKEKDISKVMILIKKRFLKNRVDYRWLFVAEVIYTYKFLNLVFDAKHSDYSRLWDLLGFKKEKEINQIFSCVMNPSLIKNKKIRNSFKDIEEFIASQQKYFTQKVFNIGVCATMSAGKSTFVNALLGADYLPARNEATTACVTSVYDNDNQSKMIGFASNKNEILEISDNLLLEHIDKWNSNKNITHIYLQSDLDDISSDKVICAVHDTPGTNNSGDKEHHTITMDFLQNNEMNALIFVANAEQLCTTDEEGLLKELYSKVVSKNNIPVLFVLNKVDNLDLEKEKLDTIISNYSDYVKKIGFSLFKIFPVSSKSARLLKIALKGKSENFTEAECDVFPSIVSKFTKRLKLGNSESEVQNNTNFVTVDGEEYESEQLRNALINTGIHNIEKEIDVIIK